MASSTSSENGRNALTRGAIVLAVFLAAAFIALGSVSERQAFSSSELRFSETSALGLQIVPASCPSNPHYSDGLGGSSAGSVESGECSVSCPSGTSWNGVQCVCTDVGGGLSTSCVSTCPSGMSWNGTRCVSPPVSCPSGTTWDGSQCVSTLCPAGYSWSGSACVCILPNGCAAPTCPSGYIWNGAQCVSTSCPVGYLWDGSQCVANQCTSQYFCSGSDRTGDGVGDDRWWRNAQCSENFSEACAWGCINGQCLPAPQGSIDIKVSPTLVRSGNQTTVTWNAENVASCTIDENNPSIGDDWSGTIMGCASGACAGSRTSSPIAQQTRYTLSCTGLDDQPYTDTATVYILPVFQEL